jgi:hypothetical protein
MESRRTWQRRRIYFVNDVGETCSLPEEWTSAAPADPFVVASDGRAKFRVDDLLRLRSLVAVGVKGIAPERER